MKRKIKILTYTAIFESIDETPIAKQSPFSNIQIVTSVIEYKVIKLGLSIKNTKSGRKGE